MLIIDRVAVFFFKLNFLDVSGHRLRFLVAVKWHGHSRWSGLVESSAWFVFNTQFEAMDRSVASP